MKQPATITISVSGPNWKALKADISNSLVSRFSMKRVRSGRLAIDDLSADQCLLIMIMAYDIEATYDIKTVIREINIVATPSIGVRIRRPVQK